MKHLIQFVGVLVIGLLAVPPAVAEGICLFVQHGQQSSMNCCDTDRAGSADAAVPATVVQDCTEGCCSVAPAQVPAPGAPDRFRSDAPIIATAQSIAVQPLNTTREIGAPVVRAAVATSDLQSWLQTYRI